MNAVDILIAVVEKTDGWVIVVVFGMYVGYHIYKKHKSGEGLRKTLEMLDGTIKSLLENLERSINRLTEQVGKVLDKV